MQKNENIDMLRGFAAVMIVICHTIQPFGGKILALSSYFASFIDVFFILSAIALGLKFNKQQLGFSFLKRRFERLSVTYYPFLIVTIIYSAFLGIQMTFPDIFTHVIFAHWLFGYDLGLNHHLWFITMIWICYFAVILNSWFKHTILYYTILIAVAICLMVAFIKTGLPARLAITSFTFIIVFNNAQWLIELFNRWSKFCILILFALINIIAIGIILMDLKGMRYLDYPMSVFIALSYLALFLKLPKWKLLIYLSTISFELYLIHYPVLGLVSRYWTEYRCSTVGILVSYIAIVVLSFLLCKLSSSIIQFRRK